MISLGKTKYGEASKLRTLKDGSRYDALFEKAPGKVYTIKKSADLADTIEFIPKVVAQTQGQTLLLSRQLKGSNLYETCKNIWLFVYQYIQYRKDETGYEQIRSPRRTWHDRTEGVDCDCYSVFISSILTNLGIAHKLRITKYNQPQFQHIYPIVPFEGSYIIIDCVTDKFDYEVPYSAKKDYNMDLQFLDGIPYEDRGLDDLGRIGKKKKKAAIVSNPASSAPAQAPAPKKKKKKGFLKKIVPKVNLKKINLRTVVSKINKINPATVLLRNGVLAAMKLNVKNIAKRLRWSYLSPEQAAAKGIDTGKHAHLVKVRQKLEKIFETAGGKASNLKKAMLGGKGNNDHAVSGLGEVPGYQSAYGSFDTSLEGLLGADIYYSENIEGFEGGRYLEGLGELGEPVTLTAVAAAMGVLTGIISQLKSIGNIFKGKQPGSTDFDEAKNQAAENNQPVADVTPVPSDATNPIVPADAQLPKNISSADDEDSTGSNAIVPSSNEVTQSDHADEGDSEPTDTDAGNNLLVKPTDNKVSPNNNNTDDKQNFWNQNKTWIKPVAVIGGSLALVAIVAHTLGNSNAKNKSSPPSGLSGIPGRKHNHKRKKKHKHVKKYAVDLM